MLKCRHTVRYNLVMFKNKKYLTRVVGAVGTIALLAIFIHSPSFPTPDKLFIFLFFVFMTIGQGWALFTRLFPFVAIILLYESFRSVADHLNSHVNYSLAPHLDRLIFGNLPTWDLQKWWWHGYVQWYDVALYIPYMLFFIIPLGVALLVWKTREEHYWEVIVSYSVLFYSAFLTFLLMPTAPPWLASQTHYITHITRVSTYVWDSLGIHNFPSLYNHLSPNPVAAFPSLHAGVSTLFSIIIFRLFGKRWGFVSLVYPLSIYVGVVYEGEHYASDVIAGAVYALGSYFVAPSLMRAFGRLGYRLTQKFKGAF